MSDRRRQQSRAQRPWPVVRGPWSAKAVGRESKRRVRAGGRQGPWSAISDRFRDRLELSTLRLAAGLLATLAAAAAESRARTQPVCQLRRTRRYLSARGRTAWQLRETPRAARCMLLLDGPIPERLVNDPRDGIELPKELLARPSSCLELLEKQLLQPPSRAILFFLCPRGRGLD